MYALLLFKISVRAEDLQKALDPTVLPLKGKVREYVYYPKKKVDNSNQSNASDQQKQDISAAAATNDPPTVNVEMVAPENSV